MIHYPSFCPHIEANSSQFHTRDDCTMGVVQSHKKNAANSYADSKRFNKNMNIVQKVPNHLHFGTNFSFYTSSFFFVLKQNDRCS